MTILVYPPLHFAVNRNHITPPKYGIGRFKMDINLFSLIFNWCSPYHSKNGLFSYANSQSHTTHPYQHSCLYLFSFSLLREWERQSSVEWNTDHLRASSTLNQFFNPNLGHYSILVCLLQCWTFISTQIKTWYVFPPQFRQNGTLVKTVIRKWEYVLRKKGWIWVFPHLGKKKVRQ